MEEVVMKLLALLLKSASGAYEFCEKWWLWN